MKALLSEVRRLFHLRRYDDILNLLEKSKDKIIYPEIYVLKGTCIQLGDLENKYQLSDVELAYKNAIAIDSEYIEAWLELGWFYLCVNDDAIHAVNFFKKASDIAYSKVVNMEINEEYYSKQMTEAIIGEARCLIEIVSIQEALNFLEKNKFNIFLDIEKIKAEKDKITNENNFFY